MTRFRLAFLAVIFLSGAVSLPAQGNQQAALARSLNDRVLQIHAQLQSAGPGAAAGLRAQGEAALAQRAAAMDTLIQQNPGQALQLAFDDNLAANLRASFPQAAGQLESHGMWEGPVDYIVFDDETMMRHRKDIHLLAANGEVLDIHFPNGVEPPGLKCGQVLRVEGVRSGNRVAAAGGNMNGESVAGAGCTSQGVQNVAVILVSFPGIPLPTNVTNQGVWDIFFASSGRSVKRYWEEASYGKASAAGNVFGPYELGQVYSCDDYYNLRSAAIAAADADAVFTGYTRVMIVFPNPGSCGWAGLGTLGCSTLTSSDGSFTASTSWLLAGYMGSRDSGVKLATHEGGHNLTLHHASSRDFGADALGALGTSGTLSEYGDSFSTMGSWNLGHYASSHKQRLSWFSTGNVETLEGSGSRTVQPFEILTGGLQALKVRRGTGNNSWLWVEYRKAIGDYDATLPSQIFSGATIHYEDSSTGTFTHLLDFTPETSSWTDPALAAGKSWTDPYSNVSIEVVSVDTNGVTLNVTFGALPCVRANPTVNLSPSSQSAAEGGNAGFNVTVLNNDSAGCEPSTFQMSSLLPTLWNALFGSSSLNIGPGISSGTTMTVYVPTGNAPGSYTVQAKATNAAYTNYFATRDAGFNVVAPPAILVSVSGTTYAPRSNVTTSATVTSGGSPAAAASVVFTMTKPNGATATKTATTSSSGVATWSYKLGPNDPNGQYFVSGQATYLSLPSNPGSDDFWVGSGPCVRANPTVAISPSSATGPAGSNFNYAVTVTNNDSSSCSASSFGLSSSLPSSWATSFSPMSLSINPGQSANSTMTKTVPAGATGSNQVDASAASGSYSGSATANFTVGELAPLTISVIVPPGPNSNGSYPARSTVSMTSTVVNGSPVAGASVVFTIRKPNNATVTKTATTSSSGAASSSYKLAPNDPSGTYTVSATTTYNGGSASTTQNATFVSQ